MSQTTLTPKVVALAHELVVYEATTASGSEATTPGAICAIQKLGRTVRTLAGPAGFRSLLSRALILVEGRNLLQYRCGTCRFVFTAPDRRLLRRK